MQGFTHHKDYAAAANCARDLTAGEVKIWRSDAHIPPKVVWKYNIQK